MCVDLVSLAEAIAALLRARTHYSAFQTFIIWTWM